MDEGKRKDRDEREMCVCGCVCVWWGGGGGGEMAGVKFYARGLVSGFHISVLPANLLTAASPANLFQSFRSPTRCSRTSRTPTDNH